MKHKKSYNYINFHKIIFFFQYMSLNDYMKNLNFRIKAKEIGEASWGDSRRKYKPMTMPTVDQLLTSGVALNKQQNSRNEMVQKYIQEQDQPVRVTVDGEVRDFKFHQVEKPYVIDEAEIADQLAEYEDNKRQLEDQRYAIRERARRDTDALQQAIQDGSDRLDAIEQRKAQLLDEMNQIQASGDGSLYGEWLRRRRLYVDLDTDETDYTKGQITRYQGEYQDILDQLDNAMRQLDGELLDNERIKAQAQNMEKSNKDEIKAYEQELLALNVGKLSTKQEPMESDEEYFERLQRLADMPYADGSTEEKARIDQKQELRDNLVSLTRNQELINQVVNGLDYENFIDVYELNKVFPIFKERFLKVYGVNNKNITAQDIIDFAAKIIKSPEPQASQQEKPEGDFVVMENALLLFSPQGDEFYFKYLEGTHRFQTEDDEGVRKVISKTDLLFYSLVGEEGSFKNINTPTTLKEILIAIGSATLGEIGATVNTTKKQFINIMKSLDIEPTDIRPDYVGVEPEGMNRTPHHIVGVGMNSDPKDIPSRVSFGDNVLDLKKLYLKNIFGISDKKGRKIHGIKNTPVSDNFVKVIFNIINGKDLLSKDLSTLTSGEKHFLELVLATSGLHKKHKTGGATQSIEKVKHDYKIIIGEIESGNNGSEIKKKLYEVLYSLAHLGAINKGQAQKQYKEIVKAFF